MWLDIVSLIIVALGLSFDTFAVSVSSGIQVANIRFFQAVKIALILAFFQAFMPVLGWFAGNTLSRFIDYYDHWIAFGLLTIVGLRMIFDSVGNNKNQHRFNPLLTGVIIMLALATSIDALAAGIGFSFFQLPLSIIPMVIGFITFLVAMLGMLAGKHLAYRMTSHLNILGGMVLIGLGFKILVQHT